MNNSRRDNLAKYASFRLSVGTGATAQAPAPIADELRAAEKPERLRLGDLSQKLTGHAAAPTVTTSPIATLAAKPNVLAFAAQTTPLGIIPSRVLPATSAQTSLTANLFRAQYITEAHRGAGGQPLKLPGKRLEFPKLNVQDRDKLAFLRFVFNTMAPPDERQSVIRQVGVISSQGVWQETRSDALVIPKGTTPNQLRQAAFEWRRDAVQKDTGVSMSSLYPNAFAIYEA